MTDTQNKEKSMRIHGTCLNLFKLLLIAALLFFFTGCATAQEPLKPVKRPAELYMKPGVEYKIKSVYDPWDGFNRRMYKFNSQFDEYVFLPVVRGYEFITPNPVEKGVSNFFNNVGEFDNLFNSIFQLKGKKILKTTGRILINSTFGLFGLFDIASEMDEIPLERQNEDFGQTLGYWGVGDGPYIVLPILGPSNLRDAFGDLVDSAAFTAADPFNFDVNTEAQMAYSVFKPIDKRHQTSFRYHETGSPAEYEMIRYFYKEARDILIEH